MAVKKLIQDQPKFGDDQCTETLVIRAARKGEDPTVFVK